MKKYELIFSEYVYKKIKKIQKQKDIKILLNKMFNKIEEKGTFAGKIIESSLNLYEVKSKKPPLRLYFEIIFKGNKAKIIDFEMKTSKNKQNNLIQRIKEMLKIKILNLF